MASDPFRDKSYVTQPQATNLIPESNYQQKPGDASCISQLHQLQQNQLWLTYTDNNFAERLLGSS